MRVWAVSDVHSDYKENMAWYGGIHQLHVLWPSFTLRHSHPSISGLTETTALQLAFYSASLGLQV